MKSFAPQSFTTCLTLPDRKRGDQSKSDRSTLPASMMRSIEGRFSGGMPRSAQPTRWVPKLWATMVNSRARILLDEREEAAAEIPHRDPAQERQEERDDREVLITVSLEPNAFPALDQIAQARVPEAERANAVDGDDDAGRRRRIGKSRHSIEPVLAPKPVLGCRYFRIHKQHWRRLTTCGPAGAASWVVGRTSSGRGHIPFGSEAAGVTRARSTCHADGARRSGWRSHRATRRCRARRRVDCMGVWFPSTPDMRK